MGIDCDRLAANLAAVNDRIAAACDRVGRQGDRIRLVAVTKSVDLETIESLAALGQVDLGESRVQALVARAQALAEMPPGPRGRPEVCWHMVGHLQRNKVKACLAVAHVIHSVDSLRLAEEISARAAQAGRVAECLMEINCSGERQKSGVAVGASSHLAEQIATLKGIRLTGLMTLAPLTAEPEEARFAFVRLRELFEDMRTDKIGGKVFEQLSMGMSNDFEVAVEEGATIVRIGTALFQ